MASGVHAPYRSAPLAVPELGSIAHHALLCRGGDVEVRVVDEDGEPVTEGTIVHEEPGGRPDTAWSEPDGAARFLHLAPGRHRFRFAPSYFRMGSVRFIDEGAAQTDNPTWTTLEVTDGGRHELVLEKAPTASLAGHVRESGIALAGARVVLEEVGDGSEPGTLTLARSRPATTDADGRYSLTNLDPGEYRLRIQHNRRAMPAAMPASVPLGENRLDCDLQVTSIRGTVRDVRGEPLGGARVEAAIAGSQLPAQIADWLAFGSHTPPVSTAADGTYELRGVEAGVALVVRAYSEVSLPGAAAPIEVRAGSTLEGVDLTLEDAGRIAVRSTLEAANSVSATFLDVGDEKVEPVGRRLRDGAAVLDGLRPGRWRVALQGRDLGGVAPREVVVEARVTAQLQF